MEVLPNYYYYYINENDGLESKTVVKRYDWRYKNWLFIPKEKKHLFQEHFSSNNIRSAILKIKITESIGCNSEKA